MGPLHAARKMLMGPLADVLLSAVMLGATVAYYILAAADFLSVVYFIGALVALNIVLVIRKQANWMARIGTVAIVLHVCFNCAYMAQGAINPFLLPPLVGLSAIAVVLPRVRARQSWLRYSVPTLGPLLCGLGLFVFWILMHLRTGFDVYFVDLIVLFLGIGFLTAPGVLSPY